MNEKSRFLLCVAGALCWVTVLGSVAARAGEPKHDYLNKLLAGSVPDCIGKRCCDDYCPKKEPCVCVPLCFGCDDYCGKKAPSVCAPLCFGCDDYCKKCPPKVCSGPLCQYLRCGSPRELCECANIADSAYEDHVAQQADVEEQSWNDTGLQWGDATPEPPESFAPVMVHTPEIKLSK